MSRRLGVAPKATPRLVRSTACRVSPETWSTSGASPQGQQGSPGQPVRADAWHPPTPGRLARRTRQQWDRSPGGTAESSADDRLGIVGVTLQRGPGKQPAHQLTALDLEAQRHTRGHPQLPGDQVGRTCLPHVAGDAVQGISAPGRRRGNKACRTMSSTISSGTNSPRSRYCWTAGERPSGCRSGGRAEHGELVGDLQALALELEQRRRATAGPSRRA